MSTPASALFGFLSHDNATQWLRTGCVLPDASDQALSAMWQAAQARLGLPVPNAGLPDIVPLPPDGVSYVTTLLGQSWVQERLQAVQAPRGVDFCLVEIDPLLAYQVHVDHDRSQTHGNGIPQNPTLQQQLDVCLPTIQTSEPLQIHQAPGAMMITSRSLNVRTLWQGYANSGFLGIHVGMALPFVHVVRFNGRCYLHNGFHRAVALRARGVTHIPCIFREVSTAMDAGIQAAGAFDQNLLESVNPPTLLHFTSGRTTDVNLKSFHRVLHVTWAEYSASND